MDDTVLDLGLRESCMDDCVKSHEVICAADKKHTLYRCFSSHSVQLLRTWRSHFLRPHSQNIFSSVQIDPNGNVDGLLHNLAFTTNAVVDGVQKDHCIDGLQRPLLPPFGDGKNLICNPVLSETEMP